MQTLSNEADSEIEGQIGRKVGQKYVRKVSHSSASTESVPHYSTCTEVALQLGSFFPTRSTTRDLRFEVHLQCFCLSLTDRDELLHLQNTNLIRGNKYIWGMNVFRN